MRMVALALTLSVLLVVAAAGCGDDEGSGENATGTTQATGAAETETTDAQDTTTTEVGFAAIAPEGYPSLRLPEDATLMTSTPPAGEVQDGVTAVYAHTANVMTQVAVWEQVLESAGFDVGQTQAWQGGGDIEGYYLSGATPDGTYEAEIVGGSATAVARQPFYELESDALPEDFTEGFVLILSVP